MKPEVDVGPEFALAVRHIKRAAEAIVGLNVGLILGAKQLRGHMSRVPPQFFGPTPALEAMLAEIPAQAQLGDIRVFLPEERLLSDDRALATVEAKHRAAVLLECRRVYFACLALQHGKVKANRVSLGTGEKGDA